MPETGQVVIWGKTAKADSPALHIYNFSFDTWRKERIQSGLCEHTHDISILPVTVQQQQQLLAVSCFHCNKIRLYNMKTRLVITAFHDPNYFPSLMCGSDLCFGPGIRSHAHSTTQLFSATVQPGENPPVWNEAAFCHLLHSFPQTDCYE